MTTPPSAIAIAVPRASSIHRINWCFGKRSTTYAAMVPPSTGGTSRTSIRAATLVVDGQRVAEIQPDEDVAIYLCEQRSLLATLPETTFFSRYRETFAS